MSEPFHVASIVGGQSVEVTAGALKDVVSPHDFRVRLGSVRYAEDAEIDDALGRSVGVFDAWEQTGVETRAAMLELAADYLEKDR
ncbi:MAG: hypothetical protein AAFV69_10620, partial [Pseudomonadota bacterium]